MSYLRAVPAARIKEIISAENDLEQEIEFIEYPGVDGDEHRWQAWDAHLPRGRRNCLSSLSCAIMP